ncbi:MAG: CDP-glycerol glycerophosphotransferase family protein, partial [Clostridiaceae bacterium]
MKKLISRMFFIINSIVPKNRYKIAFESFPDFSDNSMVLFMYMIENKYDDKYKLVWITGKKYNKDLPNKIKSIEPNKNIKIVYKKSIKGILNFLTSKYVFYTHGMYFNSKVPKSQIVFNLWHGMPLKNLGLLDNKTQDDIPKFTYCSVNGDVFVDVFMKVFGVNKEKVKVLGQPRNDLLLKESNILSKLNIDRTKVNKIILWMPTYRQSNNINEIREEGKTKDSGLPLLSVKNLYEFDEFLQSLRNICIIKLHP